MNIDRFDLEILSLLDMDARQPYSQIGKNINRSKQFIGHRIKNLLEKKIIEGYNLDVDTRRMGYTIFSIFLQFQGVNQEKERKIIDYLQKSKYVGFCLKTLGNWDLFISIRAEGINDFYKFLGTFHKFCANSIKRESINLEVKGIATNLKFLTNKEKNSAYASINTITLGKDELNEFEKKIFNKLRENPLIPYLELTNQCGRSYETVKRVLKKLKEKRIIRRTRAIIDTEKLGYNRYLFLIELRFLSDKQTEEIINYLINQRNIDYTIECVGSWNLICNVYSRDIYELMKIINELKDKFKNSIYSIEFLRVIKNEKEFFNVL